jgi:uncharacterized MAPEG superfamily protein
LDTLEGDRMMSIAQVLVWSAILTWLMLMVASLLVSKGWTAPGMEVAFGNRENIPTPMSLAGRADRAAKNMLENLAIFTALVAALHMAGKASAQAQLGANIFFWARVAYWPAYVAGIIYLRTAIWLVSIIGLAMMLAAML